MIPEPHAPAVEPDSTEVRLPSGGIAERVREYFAARPLVYGALSVPIVVAAVVYVFRAYAYHPFEQDDLAYLKDSPLTPQTFLHFWNPWWGWYFRPVFEDYIDGVLTLFHHNPFAVHAAGLVVVGLIVWELMFLARRLTGSTAAAVLAAWSFVLAPYKDEAVFWPAAANAILAALFYLTTLVFWTVWRQDGSRSPALYRGAIVAAALAFCSKEEAISLPLALVVLDYFLAPGQTIGGWLKTYAPLAVVTLAYAVCDHIAYGVAVSRTPGAELFHWNTAQRLHNAVYFIRRQTVGYYFISSANEEPAWFMALYFATVAVLAAFAARRDRLLFSCTALAVLVAMPSPLGTGMHAASGRFMFIPSLFFALVFAVATVRCLASPAGWARLIGSALIAARAACFFPMLLRDPPTIWMALLATLGCAALAWRAGMLAGRALLLMSAVAFLTQIPLVTPPLGTDSVDLWFAAYVAAGAFIGGRRLGGYWPGALIALLIAPFCYVTLPVFLIAAVMTRKARWWRSERLVESCF